MLEGDPAPGRQEVSVSPKVRFAAHEAAGGGWGGGGGGDRHAESKLVSDQLSLLLINNILWKKIYFYKTVAIFKLQDIVLAANNF